MSVWRLYKAQRLSGLALVVALGGCAHPPQQSAQPAPAVSPVTAAPIPDLLDSVPLPPATDTQTAPPLYSLSVRDVPVRDLLYAVARDAKLDLDVHPAVNGTLTMQVTDQTITEILDRIVQLLPVRYELGERHLFVGPDQPFVKAYRIDHVNIGRNLSATIGAATTVGAQSGGGGGGSGAGSGSTATIVSFSANQFWQNLTRSVTAILGSGVGSSGGTAAADAGTTTPAAPASTAGGGAAAAGAAATPAPAAGGTGGASDAAGTPPATGSAGGGATGADGGAAASAVTAYPEASLLVVYATHRQHLLVRDYLKRVLAQTARQVQIEATVVEVELFDQYQQGIDWSLLSKNVPRLRLQPSSSSGALPGGTPTAATVPSLLTWTQSRSVSGWRLDLALRLLESFGNTRVLSSPRISALHNQPALLKVTREQVYFRINVDFQPPQQGQSATFAVTSEPQTVSIGLVLQVVPHIGDNQEVTLALRPSLTSIKEFVDDPGVAVALALARQAIGDLPSLVSRVPVVDTRELESVIRVRSGQVAILGGLMQESASNATDQVPGVGSVPLLGEAFKFRQRGNRKSELVIFLRPVIVDPVTEVAFSDEALSQWRRYQQPLPTGPVGGPAGLPNGLGGSQ